MQRDWLYLSGAMGTVGEVLRSWQCYVGSSQVELLTPQFSTLSFHVGDEVCAEPVGTYLHAWGTLDFLPSSGSSLGSGLNSDLYPLSCLPLGAGSVFPGVRWVTGFGMKNGMAEDESFTLLALLWHPFLSSVSSDLGFCFLPNTQTSWLPAQVRERTYFLQLLSENNPAGTAQEQEVPESVGTSWCCCPVVPAVDLVSVPLTLNSRTAVVGSGSRLKTSAVPAGSKA